MNRSTLKSVAIKKLKASKILFNAQDYDTAGYLLGYVVECSIKALICRKLNLTDYPDTGKHHDVFASHDFDRLLLLSGYSKEIDLNINSDLFNNWSTLTRDWKTQTRYNEGVYNQNNIQEKFIALEEPVNGFLSWVKKRW
jgi:HEPN domain-containing protein